ncbi:hypothetical protein F5Y18DRAFT_425101 [Xylariaceae sp. FL1019]|nr:hypothetical protein F5Y18DRAFT_425101 [Xylariaceae sp. FL1019]
MDSINLVFQILAAMLALATPMPMLELGPSAPETGLRYLFVRASNCHILEILRDRSAQIFSLDRTWHNEVLFGGIATAKLTDHDVFNSALRLELSDVDAHAFLGVEVNATQTISLTLFSSDSPIGIGIAGLDDGVVFSKDLVSRLSEEIDLMAGFEVQVPDGSYLEADIFGDDVGDTLFVGLQSHSLPVTVVSGKAICKADLRLRVQAGRQTSLHMFGIGAGAVVGIYVDIFVFYNPVLGSGRCKSHAVARGGALANGSASRFEVHKAS